MLNILVISNNNAYNSELKRSAMIEDVNIQAIAMGIDDVRRNFASGMNPDIIILSDILFPGTTMEAVVDELKSKGMLDKVYGVIRNSLKSEYLMANNIQFVMENDVTPVDLLRMVKSPLIPSGTPREELDERVVEHMDIKNAANVFANEKANKLKAEMIQSTVPTETVLTNRGGMNSLKSIMVAVNSPKGGVGKTALSIELAFLLAARAKELDLNPTSKLNYAKNVSVCLVDFNPSFDSMAATLECVRSVPNYPTISDWVSKIEAKIFDSLSDAERQELLDSEDKDFTPYINESAIRFTREEIESLLVYDEKTGIWILPSISLPFDVEFVKAAYVRIILNQIKLAFDISIVDTGNNISFFTVETLKCADEVLLVTTPTSGSSVVLSKLIKNLDRIEVDKGKISLIINYPNGPSALLDTEVISNVLKLTVVSELPFEENLKMAHEEGVPFSIYNLKSPFAREAKKLAQQIYPLWTAVQKPKKKARGGLFGFAKK